MIISISWWPTQETNGKHKQANALSEHISYKTRGWGGGMKRCVFWRKLSKLLSSYFRLRVSKIKIKLKCKLFRKFSRSIGAVRQVVPNSNISIGMHLQYKQDINVCTYNKTELSKDTKVAMLIRGIAWALGKQYFSGENTH